MYFGGFIAYLESCRKITSILKEPEFLQSRCSGQHPRSQSLFSCAGFFICTQLFLSFGLKDWLCWQLLQASHGSCFWATHPQTAQLPDAVPLSAECMWRPHCGVVLSVREQQQWYRVLGSTASIQGSLFPQWISSLCGGMPLKVTALGFLEPKRVSFTDASCEGGALSCLHGALCVCSICVYGNHQIGLQIHQGGISLNHWSWGRVQSCETEVCFPLPPAKLGLGCTAHALSNFVQHEAHKTAALYIQYLHF